MAADKQMMMPQVRAEYSQVCQMIRLLLVLQLQCSLKAKDVVAFVDDRGMPQFSRSLQCPSCETGQSGFKTSDDGVCQKMRHAYFYVRTVCRPAVCRQRQLDLCSVYSVSKLCLMHSHVISIRNK